MLLPGKCSVIRGTDWGHAATRQVRCTNHELISEFNIAYDTLPQVLSSQALSSTGTAILLPWTCVVSYTFTTPCPVVAVLTRMHPGKLACATAIADGATCLHAR
eukprot:658054-Rhodomonas_salina.2